MVTSLDEFGYFGVGWDFLCSHSGMFVLDDVVDEVLVDELSGLPPVQLIGVGKIDVLLFVAGE